MTNPFVSVWPDLDSGGGPCLYCGKGVPGKHEWETDSGRRTRKGEIIFEPVYYHVKCRDRHQREHWHDYYDTITLGEAVTHEPYPCACMGSPNGAPQSARCHCVLVLEQCARLQRGAHIVAKLLVSSFEKRMTEGE